MLYFVSLNLSRGPRRKDEWADSFAREAQSLGFPAIAPKGEFGGVLVQKTTCQSFNVRGYILSLGILEDEDEDKENVRTNDRPNHNR